MSKDVIHDCPECGLSCTCDDYEICGQCWHECQHPGAWKENPDCLSNRDWNGMPISSIEEE